MCHNPDTWHNCSQVKLTSEDTIQIKKSKSTWEQSCQCHLRTIVPVSIWKNRASLTWEQPCHCHLGTIAAVSLGNNRASVTWEQSCQSH